MVQDEGDRKPGSVPPQLQAAMIIHLGQALPTASSDRTRRLQASNLSPTSSHHASAAGRKWERLPIWSCSEWGLPSPGVTIGTGALLPHRFTLTKHGARWSSVPCMGLAVCFLWHFPWGRPHWTLSSTLLCGARTFLPSPGSEERSSGLLRPKMTGVVQHSVCIRISFSKAVGLIASALNTLRSLLWVGRP